ncbi:MAG: BrnT family toxin, partial [Calditrichaeota bacterium]
MKIEIKKILQESTGFQWDAGNKDKNWLKHRVSHT